MTKVLSSETINKFAPLIGLLGVYLLFALIGPDSFTSTRNLETIARQTTIVGIAALGMTIVIIAGGIDLSVGSLVALSTVVIAWLLQAGSSPLVAALGGVLIGVLFGCLIGFLITRLQIAPFIVTLGMLLFIRGVAKGIANEQKIDAPLSWLNDLLASLPSTQKWMLAPAGVWMFALLAILVSILLKYFRLGKHIYAIGSNELTAKLCGIAVNRVKIIIYAVSAGLAGIAGLMQFSRLTVGDPTVAVGLELDVIASVVIGGGSLSGGEGSVLGTIVGAFIMTVIRSGCSQMGLPNWIQEIVTGLIIVVAVALDRWRHRKRA